MMTGFATPADSARVAAAMYGVSLLSLAPVAAAACAALALRRANAVTRMIVWRAAIVAVLVALVGRLSPAHWTAWVLPSIASAPLVALGRVQMAAPISSAHAAAGVWPDGFAWLEIAFAVYCAGVVALAVPQAAALRRLRSLRQRAARIYGPESDWAPLIQRALDRVALARRVRVHVSAEFSVPVTWGSVRPVIILPAAAHAWTETQIELALAHELVHVRANDWMYGLAARTVCVLFWFNPGVWWLARRMGADRELACDERVLATGAARSDYAELLMRVAEALGAGSAPRSAGDAAFALASRSGLRERLALVLAGSCTPHAHSGARLWSWRLASIALLVAVGTVRLAPTRGVLNSLMRDARWQTRAFAVVGLAQRSDSVVVARAAAERDPNPRVRAWARYALASSLSAR